MLMIWYHVCHDIIGLINISKDIELACLNLNQLLDLQTMSGKDASTIYLIYLVYCRHWSSNTHEMWQLICKISLQSDLTKHHLLMSSAYPHSSYCHAHSYITYSYYYYFYYLYYYTMEQWTLWPPRWTSFRQDWMQWRTSRRCINWRRRRSHT